MSGLEHFHHIGEVWGEDDALADHLTGTHHLAVSATWHAALIQQHNDDHLYFGYALDPPHDWDHPSDEVCENCLINVCGACTEDGCGCTHGVRWPAENPWAALWAFGPGSVGYAGAMAYQQACAENS